MTRHARLARAARGAGRGAREEPAGQPAARGHPCGARRPAERRQVEPAQPPGGRGARHRHGDARAPRATRCASRSRSRACRSSWSTPRGCANRATRSSASAWSARGSEIERADLVLVVLEADRAGRCLAGLCRRPRGAHRRLQQDRSCARVCAGRADGARTCRRRPAPGSRRCARRLLAAAGWIDARRIGVSRARAPSARA